MAVGMTVAVDCTGGDEGEGPNVAGAVQAAKDFGIAVALVGRPERIGAELAKHGTDGVARPVSEAADEGGMEEHPAQPVRRKPGASINVALKMVKEGEASAAVSAGNS